MNCKEVPAAGHEKKGLQNAIHEGALDRVRANTFPDLQRFATGLFTRLVEEINEANEPIDFGDKALDIGGKDGRYTQIIRELGPKKIAVIDPSSEDLEKGLEEGLIHSLERYCGSLELFAEILGNQKVDSAFVFNVPTLERYRDFANSLIQVVKPGGLLVCSFINEQTRVALSERLYVPGGFQGVKAERKSNSSISPFLAKNDFPNRFIDIARRSEDHPFEDRAWF